MVPSVHQTLHPKRHLNWFSRFCTAHGRQSLYFTMGAPSPRKLPIPVGTSGPHLIHYTTRSVTIDCIYVRSTAMRHTSGQSNLTTSCMFATHGQFNGIVQVTPVCTLCASLRPSESKSQTASRSVQRFCIAHRRV